MSQMDWCRGGGTAQALGSRMMTRRQAVNIIKDCVDFEHQTLKFMEGHLLLKRWGPMVNLLEMMTWPGGMPIGLGNGTMLMTWHRNIINRTNRTNRTNRMLEPCQMQKQRDADEQQDHVQHWNNIDQVI